MKLTDPARLDLHTKLQYNLKKKKKRSRICVAPLLHAFSTNTVPTPFFIIHYKAASATAAALFNYLLLGCRLDYFIGGSQEGFTSYYKWGTKAISFDFGFGSFGIKRWFRWERGSKVCSLCPGYHRNLVFWRLGIPGLLKKDIKPKPIAQNSLLISNQDIKPKPIAPNSLYLFLIWGLTLYHMSPGITLLSSQRGNHPHWSDLSSPALQFHQSGQSIWTWNFQWH